MKTVMALFTKYKKVIDKTITFLLHRSRFASLYVVPSVTKSWILLRSSKFIIIVLLGALVACWPLFHAGLIPTHDGEYHLIRFYEFDKILRSDNWYPRWAPDLNFGYGVPLFTYVYPLPNYVASLLHIFGVSFLDSVKLNMAFATLTGAVFFYLWAKRFWGNIGGTVASIFYTFSPYHFVDIYVRGSVGEVWALGLFPGFLWAYSEYMQNKKPVFGVLSVFFLSLTIFSHNILGLMFFVFAVSYMVFLLLSQKQHKKTYLLNGLILFASLCASAIFWLPALFETNLVTGLQIYNIAQNFPDLFQLLFPSWGTGFFDSNLDNQMSVQIGAANLLAVVTVAVNLLVFWKRKLPQEKQLLLFFFVWFVILFFCMLSISLPLWQHLPLMHYFQFPWRLLSLMIIVCSFLAGSLGHFKKAMLVSVLFIAFVLLTTYTYTQPAYYMLRNDAYYISRSNFIDGTNSPGNVFNTVWGSVQTSRPKSLFVLDNGTQINKIKKLSPTEYSANVTTGENQILNLSYFPSWQITVDGKTVQAYSNKGLLAFKTTKETHDVHITFTQTILETIASYISIATGAVLLFLLLRKKIQ